MPDPFLGAVAGPQSGTILQNAYQRLLDKYARLFRRWQAGADREALLTDATDEAELLFVVAQDEIASLQQSADTQSQKLAAAEQVTDNLALW